MSPESAAIASALLSGLISYVVAHHTSVRTSRAELIKLQVQTQSASFVKLLEARLACYPAFYALISLFIRTVRTPSVNSSTWQSLLDEMDAWDAAHSILLGPRTTNVCFRFRLHLRHVNAFVAATGDMGPEQERLREELYKAAEDLELALRSDLGIYGVGGGESGAHLSTPRVADYDAGEV